MKQRLYLFASSREDAAWYFCLIHDDGEITEGNGLDTAAAAMATNTGESGTDPEHELTLVVPMDCLLRTAVVVPARGRRQIEMAVPYLVEEHVAEDVEHLHLALGARQADGRVPVAVIDPVQLAGWLESLAAAGLEVTTAQPDVEGLLDGSAQLRVLVDATTAWIGTADGIGLAIDRELLLQVLTQWMSARDTEDRDEPVTIALTLPEQDPALDLAELDSALGQVHPVRIERETYVGAGRRQLALALASHTGLNLLQGRFAQGRETRSPWYRWRLVAGLAASLLLLQMGLDIGRTAWLEQRAVDLRAQAVAQFQTFYPGRTRVPDPRRELEALLDGGTATGAGFLELLGASATGIAEIEGGAMSLRSLSFNAQRGDLAIDLDAAGIGSVDGLKERLESRGYPVVIDSAVQEAQGVRARLRVRQGGA